MMMAVYQTTIPRRLSPRALYNREPLKFKYEVLNRKPSCPAKLEIMPLCSPYSESHPHQALAVTQYLRLLVEHVKYLSILVMV